MQIRQNKLMFIMLLMVIIHYRYDMAHQVV